MTHLFQSWDRISARLGQASRINLLLDFDGTLALIRRRPEEVSIDSAARDALQALVRNPRCRVSVISGRRRADVCSRLRIPGIRCLGLYGWEGPHGVELPPATLKALDLVRKSMRRKIRGMPGVWIEEKVHALSVHYREAPAGTAEKLLPLLQKSVAPFTYLLRIQPGRCVYEVIPRELGDKGTAVRRETAVSARGLPIYLGDDQPDEAAFTAMRHGITILVGGEHPSRAQYRLTGVPEVRTFLRRLNAELA